MSSHDSHTLQEVGLLPHEEKYVQIALRNAQEASRLALLAVGEAVADSGGDWAYDDPGSIHAAHHAVLKDADRQRLQSLVDLTKRLPATPYPDPSDSIVRIGSRISYTTLDIQEICDLVTHRIPGIPEEHGVGMVSAQSPLGTALLGRQIGESVEWRTDRSKRFNAVIAGIDQGAQRDFYSRLFQLADLSREVKESSAMEAPPVVNLRVSSQY